MQIASRKRFLSFFALICLLLCVQFANAQPPVIPPTGTQPPSVDPKTLTNTQLTDLLKDNNTDGVDLNAKVNKDLHKDSIVNDGGYTYRYNPKNTYGMHVFQNAAMYNVGELSTPPLDYPIGVGDEIIVAMWGGAEVQISYTVAKDGSIFPTSLGKIIVQGLTYDAAASLLRSRFLSVVPPGTNISITLGKPRTIVVNVVGNVNNPGPVSVSAFSNAFNVIGLAGGVNEFGDLRNIQIKRNGVNIDNIDVYRYLTSGDLGKHIYLQNNDFIIVGFFEKKVFTTGQFKRPMYYQLKKGEGLKALIGYAGGFTPDALASNVQVFRTVNEEKVQHDVNANAILKIAGQDFELEDGDIVKVNLVKEGIRNKVEVRGEVNYPSVYEYRKGDRLFDLINRAGGITTNTYLNKAYILRGAADSTVKTPQGKIEVNLIGVSSNLQSDSNNVVIMPNDVIQIFSNSQFADPQYVEIFGEVRQEGKVKSFEGMTLEDLIYFSGGLRQSAEFGRLEISSVVDLDSARRNLKPARTVVKRYSIDSDLRLDTAARNVVLKPYDQVFVRKNTDFELQKNVELRGMFKYEGFYTKINKMERLSSFVQRAGGFAENADLSGAVLFRSKKNLLEKSRPTYTIVTDALGRAEIVQELETVKPDSNSAATLQEKISIDLYKAMRYKNSKYDLVMQEDDILFVPNIEPFVKVVGQVQSPLKISYDKEHTNARYYIDKAGGFGVKPWRKRLFVTYANGKSRRTKSFLFFNFYPNVEEGSVVTVPVKPEGQTFVEIAKGAVVAAIPVILTGLLFKYIRL